MNAFKRYLLLSLLIGTPLVCGVVTAVKFQQNVTQQNRNAALIAAIEADKNDEAIRLLASGADANARKLPPDTRTFWQKVRELWRPVRTDETAYPSALTLALRRDMNVDNPNAPETRFQLFKSLHDGGAKEEGKSAAWDGDLQKDVQAMKADTDSPLELASSAFDLNDTNERLVNFLISQGMSARAVADWADCRFRYAKYTDAVCAYRIAALWQPNDAGLQARLAQAEEYERVRTAIGRTLPASQSVNLVRPYPSEAHPAAWVAVYSLNRAHPSRNLQVGFFAVDGAELRQVGHTPLFHNGQTGDYCENGINLYVFPLTGRAAPEIVLCGYFDNSRSAISFVDVFACKDGRFHSIASVTSDYSMVIERAPHGSRYVIRRYYPTGDRMYGGCSPLRPDLYAFNGKRFAPADAQYPEAFDEYIKDAAGMLHAYPDDYDLRQNLAYMYSITGSPQKSEQYYREAERLCREAIAQESKENAEYDRKILAQIVARDPERHF